MNRAANLRRQTPPATGHDLIILRPDPAEYVEDFGCGPLRSIDVLTGALGYAATHGLTIHEAFEAAIVARCVRDFDRIVAEIVEQRRRAA